MVELTSRCLAFAEAVVTMVCPVLLALALKKDKRKPALVPAEMLAVAGATLVTGICPLLACCITERFPKACKRWPSVTRGLAATFSSACLLVLACWISLLVVSESFVIVVGFLSGICLVIRATSYWTRSAEQRGRRRSATSDVKVVVINGDATAAGAKEEKAKEADQQLSAPAVFEEDEEEEEEEEGTRELCTVVDKSHEFLSGVTGILFLGLEGLALEGLLSTRDGRTTGDALRPHMTVSLFTCALGVTLMFVQMVPPRAAAMTNGVVYFTDVAMAVGTAALLVTIMVKLMGVVGLLFLASPLLILVQLLYTVKINAWRAARLRRAAAQQGKLPNSSPPPCRVPSPVGDGNQDQSEEAKPAPMGLTKVTFTGFLAVSVRAISGGSGGSPGVSVWTVCFLLFAAAAIASGVSWRLLTHTQNKSRVGGKAAADEAANVASFCTHLCVAVATVLFAVMAWEAGTAAAGEHAGACAHVSEVTCVHLDKILDVQLMRNMCTCIEPCT